MSDVNMQPPGGHFHMNLFEMCRFSGLKIDQKFRKRVMTFCSITKGIVFKNNRLLFSYCFVIQKFRNSVSKCKFYS